MLRHVLLCGTSMAMAAAALPAFAQSASGSTSVEELVVTAQRREENLQNVPVAVTALTGQQLERNDVRDISRVEMLTPGFTFGRSGSDARPSIRGVRTENVAVSGDPTIGFYVDGIYQTRAAQALQPFVDVARVEVERGPQGTLYGRNTFGGSISVVTNTPKPTYEAGVSGIVGDFNRYEGEGYVNVPLSDKVQVRVAGLREKMDGWVKAPYSGEDIYSRDTSYVRLAARIAPTDRLEAILRYSYWQEGGTGAAAFGYRVGGIFVNPTTGANDLHGVPLAVNPKALDGIPDVAGVDKGFPIEGGPLTFTGDVRLKQKLRQHAFNAQVNYDFGAVQFHSITSYENFRVFRNGDNDFSPRHLNVDSQDDRLHTWTQEFQLASKAGAPLDWIVGYYYLREVVPVSVFASFLESNMNGTSTQAVPTTTSNAVYGQASYFLVPDKLRVTAGVRYTSDKKDIARDIATFAGSDESPTFTDTGQRLHFKFRRTTWRGDVDYFVTPANMLYASVSSGFRSGGFNSGAFLNPAIPGAFGPETVTAYEAGSKNRFLDGKLQLNLSVYRNEFRNLQVQNQFLVPASSGGFTTSSAILNAASAHSQGLEFELEAIPVEHLDLALTGTIMEAKYDSYANVPAPALYSGTFNLSGNRVPYAPQHKFTATASYDLLLGEHGTLRPAATVLWSGDYYLTDFNTSLDHQPSFTKVDLRLTWLSPEERYRVEAFVDNAGNKVVLNRATFGSAGLNESYDAPRMWGVRVAAKF